ncbi:hypothetical protein KP509_17G067900 [Ceratopteris richardii]|uniref:Transcription initiation factor IIB n=1 Tax=Ceratopteris richardii TaxID=49495 RepID=A0A8T2SX22_CERRI|nr:hypothetical protein KP509_17G067900 [Ceratopteris richardii]KAH7373669.1 hypothetical protein KP509_17G067900 [Ceratopteris richardii]KAH7373670.1 hypothetical protein KP509_17G067900 [Ceratopteris richardii]
MEHCPRCRREIFQDMHSGGTICAECACTLDVNMGGNLQESRAFEGDDVNSSTSEVSMHPPLERTVSRINSGSYSKAGDSNADRGLKRTQRAMDGDRPTSTLRNFTASGVIRAMVDQLHLPSSVYVKAIEIFVEYSGILPRQIGERRREVLIATCIYVASGRAVEAAEVAGVCVHEISSLDIECCSWNLRNYISKCNEQKIVPPVSLSVGTADYENLARIDTKTRRLCARLGMDCNGTQAAIEIANAVEKNVPFKQMRWSKIAAVVCMAAILCGSPITLSQISEACSISQHAIQEAIAVLVAKRESILPAWLSTEDRVSKLVDKNLLPASA